MSYEVKLFTGRVCHREGPDGSWFEVFTMVDLCDPGWGSKLKRLTTDQDRGQPVYFYGLNADDTITRDKYDKRLHAISAGDVLAALDEDMKRDSYWRFKAAAAQLRAVIIASAVPVYVVLYGY